MCRIHYLQTQIKYALKKSEYLFLLIILVIPGFNIACDVCGNGSRMMNNFNLQNANYSLISFRMASWKSIHPKTDFNKTEDGYVLSDHFITTDLTGRFRFKRKSFISIIAPYHFYQRTTTNDRQDISGFGDIISQFQYNLIDQKSIGSSSVQHTLSLFYGLKLPTGKYQQRGSNGLILPMGLQTGTGAFSHLGQIAYFLRKNNSVILVSTQYWMNMENELRYRFGDQLNFTTMTFQTFSLGQFTLIPNLGLMYDFIGQDKEFGYDKSNTGQVSLRMTTGFDVAWDRFYLQLGAQVPLWHQADAAVPKEGYRWNVALTFML